VQQFHTTKTSRQRFTPHVQALEERWCPATSLPSSKFGFAVSANVLTINGDANANMVTVFDDGQGGIWAKITTTGKKLIQTFKGIDALHVNTMAGNDSFTYALTGPAKKNINMNVNLGPGNNRANLDLLRDMVGRQVNINVQGGAGNDQVWLQAGMLLNTTLNCNVALGLGNNAFNGFLNSDLLGHSTANIMASASGGSNLLLMNAHHVNVAQGSAINIGLQGGSGQDIIATDYLGELDGMLTVRHHGGGGNDQQTVKIAAEPGSIGRIDSLTSGDAGDDKFFVSFLDHSADGPGMLHRARGKLASVKIVADGGTGLNSLTRVGGSIIQPLNMQKVVG
jgi:hypothetical protein